MESSAFTTVLVHAMAQATRAGGAVRIEQFEAGWEASIVVGGRRIAIARDDYLEAALSRLQAHAAATVLG